MTPPGPPSPAGRQRAPGAASEEFEAFVAGAQRELRRLCWALTGDRGLGEDLAQTTLEKVWRRWPSISGDPVAYARRVAVNESVSWKRRWAWRREIVRDVAGEGQDSLAAADRDGSDAAADRLGVEQWLAELPARYRAVVVLRYLLDMSIDETAAALDCSPGTVKSRSSRALNQLRAGLEAGAVEAPAGAAPIRSTPAVRGGQS